MKNLVILMLATAVVVGCRSTGGNASSGLEKLFEPDLAFYSVTDAHRVRLLKRFGDSQKVEFTLSIVFDNEIKGELFSDALALHECNKLKRLLNVVDKSKLSDVESLRSRIRPASTFQGTVPFEALDGYAWLVDSQSQYVEIIEDGKFLTLLPYSLSLKMILSNTFSAC